MFDHLFAIWFANLFASLVAGHFADLFVFYRCFWGLYQSLFHCLILFIFYFLFEWFLSRISIQVILFAILVAVGNVYYIRNTNWYFNCYFNGFLNFWLERFFITLESCDCWTARPTSLFRYGLCRTTLTHYSCGEKIKGLLKSQDDAVSAVD